MKKTKTKKSNIWQKMIAIFGMLVVLDGFQNTDSDSVNQPQQVTSEQVLNVTNTMEVHFIDVGQGDATLIKFDEASMLIDAGSGSKGTAVQLYLKKQGVEKLDYLILTHTDYDHIGGADVIITKFEIDNILIGGYQDESQLDEIKEACEYKGLIYSTPEVGAEYPLGDAAFTILAPNAEYDEDNNSSIALKLEHGENTFLFTGDCEEEAEGDILQNGIDIDCDVYKVGHHGSNTSSSTDFLETISPAYGVISCGEGNSYGHPHAGTLNKLRGMGTKVFRTDEQGSIIAYSDGKEISWNCAPSETWQAGEYKQSNSEQVQESILSEQKKNESANWGNEESQPAAETSIANSSEKSTYICNKNPNSMKFHYPTCESVSKMKESNKLPVTWTREEAISNGYSPCGSCKP